MSLRSIYIIMVTGLLFFTTNIFAAGEVHDGKVSAYLQSSYEDVASVSSKLSSGGFEVLGKSSISPDLTTVIFTCPTLKKLGNQDKRGFAAVMRVLVDKKDNQISITNPIYFLKAYLQKSYDEASAKKVLAKINATFSSLKDSKDALKFKDLAGYHFTFGMPYYEDMDVVAKGSHDTLVSKIKASGNVAFILTLSANRTLVGLNLDSKLSSFVNKIGTQNALVLPYPIFIEGDKAYSLAAKYYLALSYPQLKMTQFMTIATVPGKIEKACKKVFK